MIGLLCKWMYNMEVATLFLMLASERTIEVYGSLKVLIVMLSRSQIYFLILWVQAWKENQSKKEFVFFPRKTLYWKKKKRGEIHYTYCSYWLIDYVIGIVVWVSVCWGIDNDGQYFHLTYQCWWLILWCGWRGINNL